MAAGVEQLSAKISIHAPTRGATDRGAMLIVLILFQSTLPRGERPFVRLLQHAERVHFNPRSHDGSDLRNHRYGLALQFQSTLPRWERRHERCRRCDQRNFNPRSHEGSDGMDWRPSPYDQNFNPRSHEGSDSAFINSSGLIYISIHAPTRGATEVEPLEESDPYDFNPRSHEGSDLQASFLYWVNGISIHAPTRGATDRFPRSPFYVPISIHAPTRGATQQSLPRSRP